MLQKRKKIEIMSLFLLTNGNYKEDVIAGTNIGRDADTISNLVGTLSKLPLIKRFTLIIHEIKNFFSIIIMNIIVQFHFPQI